MILMFDSGVMLLGEIRGLSLLGISVLNFSTFEFVMGCEVILSKKFEIWRTQNSIFNLLQEMLYVDKKFQTVFV